MRQRLLEAGKIVNTHGTRGEVKVVPWADSAEFLCGFDCVYMDDTPFRVEYARPHKGNALMKLEGVDDIQAAMLLKERVLSIDAEQAALPEGRHFLADLIGLEVRDASTGAVLGVLSEVLTMPAQHVYVVEGPRSCMIPAVDAFIAETNVREGFLRVNLIEGMEL